MKYVDGDLIELAHKGMFDVIGHGCNCFGNMGAGIAKAIREQFPEVYHTDKFGSRYGDTNKLGTYTHYDYPGLTVLNLYTQFKYGTRPVEVDYDAVRKCMKGIKENYSGKRIGLPLIGAGLAGGDWKIISRIIEDELGDEDVTIVKFKNDGKN